MVRFEDFEAQVLPHLPGALGAAVESAFFTAARTFYRRTRAWVVELPGLQVLKGGTTIPLNPVDQTADIVMVERARCDDNHAFVRYRVPDPHTIFLDAGVDARVTVWVSVQPTRDARTLPDFALTHHEDALVAGCLARMMAQPSKPYTDKENRIFYERRFQSEIARAISLRSTGAGQHSVPWRYPVVPLT